MSRVVPWLCREEWLTTYNNLYNFQDTKLQKQGVQRVQAWKSRCNDKLPLSIDVTASLITAIISDVEKSATSSLMVRLTMAMAIVRFVNGMVDMEQKGVYARSVQSIADDIGLPDWLVDLRHEATHAALPSLEVLRTGCEFSLGWLNNHYWLAQIAEFQKNKERLVKLVQKFVEDFESDGALGETKKMRKKKYLDAVKEIVQITSQYDMWDFTLDTLLGKHGALIPSTATLEQLVVQWPDIAERPSENSVMALPKESFTLWGPIFKAWHNENELFLSMLVIALIQKISIYETCLENIILARYLACWVCFILLNSSSTKSDAKTWKIKFELDCCSILKTCLQNPSSYTPVFLPLILKGLKGVPDTSINKLVKLSSFVTGSTACKLAPNCVTSGVKVGIYDNLLKHYPQLGDYVESKLKNSHHSNNSEWQLCDASFISSIPVGGLIGCPVMEFERLELPDEPTQIDFESGNQGHTGLHVADTHEFSGDNCDIEDEPMDGSLSEMQHETQDDTTTKGLHSSVIRSIGQEIWIF